MYLYLSALLLLMTDYNSRRTQLREGYVKFHKVTDLVHVYRSETRSHKARPECRPKQKMAKVKRTRKLQVNNKLRKELTRVYPKVFGLAAWSQNCKWYSSLTLGAVVSLFCESV
jgi:hypothetical protein